MLIGPLEIQINRSCDLRPCCRDALERESRIGPHVHDVVHFVVIGRFGTDQLFWSECEPRLDTTLLDAIGHTVKDIDRRLRALPETEKPGKVILAIFTDGYENASREYTLKHISDLIRLYRDEKGWEFLFLAANQDAIATASALNMDAHSSGNVKFSLDGVKSSGGAMSRKVRAMRMKSSGSMDAQAMKDEVMSMDQIVKEEEGKP